MFINYNRAKTYAYPFILIEMELIQYYAEFWRPFYVDARVQGRMRAPKGKGERKMYVARTLHPWNLKSSTLYLELVFIYYYNQGYKNIKN